jgi:tetratricopeptide (TPR) repeat protein
MFECDPSENVENVMEKIANISFSLINKPRNQKHKIEITVPGKTATMNSNNHCNVQCFQDLHRAASLEHPAKRVRLDSVSELTEIGISHFHSGKHCTAEKYFSQALSKSMFDMSQLKSNNINHRISWLDRVSDPDSDSGNGSGATRACHEYDEGLLVYETPLEIDKKSEESIASTLFYNIALTYVRRGLCRESRSWFLRSLSYSEDPQVVFRTLSNLGYASYRSGCNDKALLCYKQALDMAPHLGLPNVALAASMNSVAVLHFYKPDGSSGKAMELFQQSLEVYQSDEENNKKQIATVLNNIGRVQYLQSECKRALDSYGKALNLRKEQFGAFSMDVAATYYNIGQAHQQLRDFEKAKEYYDLFLQVARSCLGPTNTEIGIVYRCIGDIHVETRELKSAVLAYEKSLTTSRASLGKSHPTVAATLNKAGNICYEMGDLQKSLQYYIEGLAIERNVLEPNHPHMIITLSNIAHVYKLSGQYAKSLSAYRRVLNMQETVFGRESVEVANAFSNIGLMEYNLKDFEASFESYQEALRIRREVYRGENHLCIAATLNSIGLVVFKRNKFQMAKECFVKALNIRQNVLGPSHYDVAILWYNIATTCFETGDDNNAIQLYMEARRIERANLGESHDVVIQTVQHLASIFQQLGRLDEAAMEYRGALNLLQQKENRNFPWEVKLLNLLGNLYLQHGDVMNAIEAWTKATRTLRANNLSDDSLHIIGLNYYSLSRMHPPCASVA